MIPIVFIHRGLPFLQDRYLRIAVCQARAASPDNDVYLLTDYRRPGIKAKQVRLRSLGWPTCSFDRAYEHHSTNRVRYEKFCFHRWFYLREFMELRRIDRVVVLDSDIMLFSPIKFFVDEFLGYDCGTWSWANVVTLDGAEIICRHLIRVFSRPDVLAKIAEKYPVVSDMTCMRELPKLPHILDQDYMVGIGFDPNFESTRDRHQTEKFHFLHFQGKAKRLMKHYA